MKKTDYDDNNALCVLWWLCTICLFNTKEQHFDDGLDRLHFAITIKIVIFNVHVGLPGDIFVLFKTAILFAKACQPGHFNKASKPCFITFPGNPPSKYNTATINCVNYAYIDYIVSRAPHNMKT